MTEPTGKSRIGVTGLAVMGANLARNIARAGHADRRAQPDDGEDDRVHEGVRRRGPVHRLRDASRTS